MKHAGIGCQWDRRMNWVQMALAPAQVSRVNRDLNSGSADPRSLVALGTLSGKWLSKLGD